MDITLKDLPSYLKQIHTFLIKNGKSYFFPSLTMGMEDILVSIAKDPNFLKKFDDTECKSIARQIIEVLEENKQIYTLSFSFENCEHWKRVMVYKKIPVPVPIFNEPLGLKQLRKPHSPISQTATPNDTMSTNTVMSSFKVTCLNTTLKFVKNDDQLLLQYPDVSAEQAEFIKHMIAQCLSPKDCSTSPGGRSMFEPLAEALKIYSTKYTFKLNNVVPVKIEMKRLFFEKTPKEKDWLQIPKNISEKELDVISISSLSSEESSNSHQTFAQLIKSLDCTFIRNTIFDIEEFLLHEKEKIEFKNLTIPEETFTMQWKSVLIGTDVIKLFDEDVRDSLKNIRSLVTKYAGVCKIRTTMQKVSPTLRNVYLRKKSVIGYNALMQLTDYAKMAKPAPLIETEKDVNHTTTNSVPTSKKTENSCPVWTVKSDNDVHSMTVNLNSVTKVTEPIKTDVPTDKNRIENDIIYDNAPANSMPTLELNIEPETSVKVNTDVTEVNTDIMEVNNETNWNTISLSTEKSKTESNRTLLLSSADNIPCIDRMPEVTSETNATLNSLDKENASGNSLTDKSNAEICKLNRDDFINRTASCGDYFQSDTILSKKKWKDILLMRSLLNKTDGVFVESAIIKIKEFILSTSDTLYFTQLTKDEQDVILSWENLINSNDIISMFCVRGQLLCAEIRRLLEKGKGSFSIAITSKTCSAINRTITFTKTIKKKPTLDTKPASESGYTDWFDQLVSFSNCVHTKKPVHQVKKIQRFLEKTQYISEEWIIRSLKQLRSFIMDDAQASLVMYNVNSSQTTFLTKWQNVLGRREVIATYNINIQLQLLDVHKCMAKKMSQFRISSKCTNVKMDYTRDITFVKTPYFKTKQLRAAITAPKVKKNKVKIAAKTKANKTEIATKIVEATKRDTIPTEPGKTEISFTNMYISLRKKLNEKIPKEIVSADQGIPKSSSVTSLGVKKVPVLSERVRPKSATVNHSLPLKQAKAKLIEALSQPLVSERGLKMMRNMGWDGGALGLRGEGIVEPIALPLDLKRGAGLGCEKQPIHQPKLPAMTNLPVNITRVVLPHHPCKNELKTGFLQTILNMLEATQPATELNFPNKLTLKNWAFVKQSVIAMNKRVVTKHDVPALAELTTKIVKALSQSQYIITACWGVTKMNVLFLLVKNIHQPLELDSKDWCSVVNFEKDEEMLVNTDNVIVAGEVFRYYVLSHILEFCQPNITIDKVPAKTSSTKELSLKGMMVSKHMSYIMDLIRRLNNKSRSSSDCEKERAIFDEIKNAMQGFTLDVDFPLKCTDENKPPVYNVIRFYKIFDTKQNTPTHSAKIDANNEKAVAKRRTTFTDAFDEKGMFDNQNTPIVDQNAPKLDENAQTNISNLKHDGDCICCLKDYEMKDVDVDDEPKDVEYIFVEKETIESEDIRPVDTVIKENIKSDNFNEEKDKTSMTIDEDEGKNIEYIFLEKETVVSVDIRPVDTVIKENMKSDNVNEEKDETSMTTVNFEKGKNKTSMTVENVDAENDKTMTIENSDEDEDKTITIENLDEDKDKTSMTVENVDAEKDKTISIENSDEDEDKTIIIENLDEDKDKTMIIENLDEEKDKKLNTTENLDEDIQSLSISDKNTDWTGFSEDIKLFLEKNAQITNSNDQESNKDICKRPISNSSTPGRVYKKGRFEKYSKKINITPNNYPESEITNEIASKIQTAIIESIDYADDLPLLECHGIQNGGLAYSCHTEKSFNFLTNLIKSLNYLVTITEGESKCHKMTVKLRSFVKEGVDTIFDRLETYNMSLDTKNWKVIDIERSSDSVVISMKVDEDSFKFIYRQNFTLYTGIDQAKFSILWD